MFAAERCTCYYFRSRTKEGVQRSVPKNACASQKPNLESSKENDKINSAGCGLWEQNSSSPGRPDRSLFFDADVFVPKITSEGKEDYSPLSAEKKQPVRATTTPCSWRYVPTMNSRLRSSAKLRWTPRPKHVCKNVGWRLTRQSAS